MIRARLIALVPLVVAATPFVARAAAEVRPADPSEIPVMLSFEDRPVAQVLMGLFAVAGVRGDIDPCVTGRISITLKNATLGSALDAVARLADLDIRRGAPPRDFHVTCRDTEAARSRAESLARSGEPASLRFRIETVDAAGRMETIGEPRLIVPVGELAEIAQHVYLPDYALAADGELIVNATRPSWSLRVIVVPARDAAALEIRGILQVSFQLSENRDGGVVTLTRPFRSPLTPEREVRLVSTELGATTLSLILID